MLKVLIFLSIIGLIVLLHKLLKKKKGDGFWVIPNSGYDYTLYYFWILALILVIIFSLIWLFSQNPEWNDKMIAMEATGVNQVLKEEINIDDFTFTGDVGLYVTGEDNKNNPFENAKLVWPYTVDKVIDGDTIRIRMDGVSTKIRFIGVNTPEIWDCFSYPAKDFVNAKVGGTIVYLEMDDNQWFYDKYGRILAYVYSKDYENINYSLLDQGYAKEYTYSSPYRYQDVFKKGEKTAHEKNLWLWNDCR